VTRVARPATRADPALLGFQADAWFCPGSAAADSPAGGPGGAVVNGDDRLMGGSGIRPRARGRGVPGQVAEELDDAAAQGGVGDAAAGGELGVNPGHRQHGFDQVGAGHGEDLAQVGQGPGGAAGAGTGADRRGRLAVQDAAPRGRDAQSRAFFSWPGMDPLYSGVAISTASAAAISRRSPATPPARGLPPRPA